MKLIISLFILLFTSVNSYAFCTSTSDTFSLVADSNSNEVKDNRTGLIWRRCPLGMSYDTSKNSCSGKDADDKTYEDARAANTYKKWIDALNAVVTFNSNNPGKNWRMANVKEIASIAEASCGQNKFFTTYPNITRVWISTPLTKEDGNSYSFDFEGYKMGPGPIINTNKYSKIMVLVVRDSTP